MQDTDPRDDNLGVARSIGEIVDRTTLLVHDEIELAKAEVRSSLQDLLRGSVAGVLGGVFAVFGLVIFLQALALFLNDLFDWDSYPWLGYLTVAMGLFIIGGIVALFAMRSIKKGSQLTPEMAIEEARKTQEALKGPEPLEAEAVAVTTAAPVAAQPAAAVPAQPAAAQPAQPVPAEPAPLPPLDEKTAKRAAKEAEKARAQAEKEAAKQASEAAKQAARDRKAAEQAAANAKREAAKAQAAADKQAAKQAAQAEKLAKQEEKARAKAAKKRGDTGGEPPQPPAGDDPGQEGD